MPGREAAGVEAAGVAEAMGCLAGAAGDDTEDGSVTAELTLFSGELVTASVPPGSTIMDLKIVLALQLSYRWPMLQVVTRGGVNAGGKRLVEEVLAEGPLTLAVVPNRSEAVYNAKMAATIGKPDDMVRSCVCFAQLSDGPLSADESELMKAAFGACRQKILRSWRTMSTQEQAERQRGRATEASFCQEEREKCEAEFEVLREELVQVLTTYVIPEAPEVEARSWREFQASFTL